MERVVNIEISINHMQFMCWVFITFAEITIQNSHNLKNFPTVNKILQQS